MITARSPYQIYKAEDATGTVSDFNSLLIEDVLPYKIASAEETLVASLELVEKDETQKTKYAVSTLHAAATYVSHLISYVPLSARSQTAKKIEIHYDAVVRTVILFGADAALFETVRNMVLRNAPANQVSLKELSDLEGALNTMEKEYRQKAKDAGEKVDMLRKVAPEPVVVAPTSTPTPQPTTTATAAGGDEYAAQSGASSSTSPGKRRRPSVSAEEPAADGGAEGTGSESKVMKIEGSEGKEGTASAAAAGTTTSGVSKASPKPRKTKKAAGVGLVWGRLRGLTTNEKKAVGVLQTIIQLLAHIYATKVNDLVPLFDLLEEKVKTVQAIIDTERAQYEANDDRKPPEPFHEVDLAALRVALETSSHVFRTDEECRYELDEDLLHPIAHACLTVINQIEGYATSPFTPPTQEEMEKKQQLRDAARAKREEAKRRILEKAEAKAELERKREEEKQLVRRRLGDNDRDDEELVEDTALLNPSTLGYIAYAPETPLGSPALYEKALYVWSMLVSVPRALNLSQMYFETFLKGLLCEDQDANGLMEEVTKCLLEVSMEVVRVNSPNTPRIATRGKNWFDALVEFVGVASGNKRTRQQQQRRRREPSTEEEEEEEEEEETEESDDTSTTDEEDAEDKESSTSSSSSTTRKEKTDADSKKDNNTSDTAAKAEETAEAQEEVDTDPFTAELKATMENIARLRSLATWGNVDVEDRLNLLRFCLQEALTSEAIRNEADRLQKESEEEVASTDKRLKDIRDEAEKELKALLRTLPAATSTGGARKRTKAKCSTGQKKGPKENGVRDNEGGEAGETADGGDAAADDEDAEDDHGAVGEQEAERDYEAEREAILTAVDRKRAEVYASVFAKQDGKDDGAVVEPLGMDRYHRLYWRFPLERVVWVQTVPGLTLAGFPVLPEPEELRARRRSGRVLLLDDEEAAPRTRGTGRSAPASQPPTDAETTAATQTDWGVIPNEYLATFVQSLDRRGTREGPLRRVLETLAPYLEQLEEYREGRVTRSRANMFGYMNQLKVDFSY